MCRDFPLNTSFLIICYSPKLLYMVASFQEGESRKCQTSSDVDKQMAQHHFCKTHCHCRFKWMANRCLSRRGGCHAWREEERVGSHVCKQSATVSFPR